MNKPRTTPVSITPAARDALREAQMEVTVAARAQITMSDTLRVLLALALRHRDELASVYTATIPGEPQPAGKAAP
jgi:hypothetical protein